MYWLIKLKVKILTLSFLIIYTVAKRQAKSNVRDIAGLSRGQAKNQINLFSIRLFTENCHKTTVQRAEGAFGKNHP